MRTSCQSCRTFFRSTRFSCPHCGRRNAGHPLILFTKLFAAVCACAAVWLIVTSFTKGDAAVPEPVPAVPAEPSLLSSFLRNSTPAPESSETIKFAR